jgi:hypothetical protein
MGNGLMSVFKNGGPNYSFGRVFSGLALAVGLTILAYGVFTDYTPYQVTKYENGNSYVVTEFKHKVDGANLQSLMIGIATLAGAIYGMSKLGAAAETFAAAKAEPPADPPRR